MTNILFYLTPYHTLEDVFATATRVIEKSLRGGHQTVVGFDNDKALKQFIAHIQSLADTSFFPYTISKETLSYGIDDAIIFAHGHTPNALNDVFINFGSQTPVNFSRFNRLIEWVWQEENALIASRARYKFYKQRGYPLTEHDLRHLST